MVTVKVAPVAPAGMVTLAGVLAEALSSDKVTTTPPAGAGPVKRAVPVESLPPGTVEGFNDTEESVGGLMVRVAVLVVPPYVAETVAEVVVATAVVFTAKVAVSAPAGTVTLAGTVAAALSLASATCAPPAGAGLPSSTVPVEELPPITLVGLRDTVTGTVVNISAQAKSATGVVPLWSDPTMMASLGLFKDIVVLPVEVHVLPPSVE